MKQKKKCEIAMQLRTLCVANRGDSRDHHRSSGLCLHCSPWTSLRKHCHPWACSLLAHKHACVWASASVGTLPSSTAPSCTDCIASLKEQETAAGNPHTVAYPLQHLFPCHSPTWQITNSNLLLGGQPIK